MSRGAVEADSAPDSEVKLEAEDGGEPTENPVATEDMIEVENEVTRNEITRVVVGSGGATDVPQTTTARGPMAQPSEFVCSHLVPCSWSRYCARHFSCYKLR